MLFFIYFYLLGKANTLALFPHCQHICYTDFRISVLYLLRHPPLLIPRFSYKIQEFEGCVCVTGKVYAPFYPMGRTSFHFELWWQKRRWICLMCPGRSFRRSDLILDLGPWRGKGPKRLPIWSVLLQALGEVLSRPSEIRVWLWKSQPRSCETHCLKGSLFPHFLGTTLYTPYCTVSVFMLCFYKLLWIWVQKPMLSYHCTNWW